MLKIRSTVLSTYVQNIKGFFCFNKNIIEIFDTQQINFVWLLFKQPTYFDCCPWSYLINCLKRIFGTYKKFIIVLDFKFENPLVWQSKQISENKFSIMLLFGCATLVLGNVWAIVWYNATATFS